MRKYELKLQNFNVAKDDLIEDCKRVAELLEKETITQRDYLENGNYSVKTVYNKFGDWGSFLNASEMELSTNIGREITNTELFENLELVWTTLGRQPKYREMMKPLSEFHSSTYERRFGSWTKALQSFVEYIDSENKNSEIETLTNRQDSTHRTPRSINLRLRFKVLQRDNFKCVKCGASPSSNPEIKLQVDHIQPYSKGGETNMDNLQTLCFNCNQGKSNLANV